MDTEAFVEKIPYYSVKSVSFGIYDSEEIRKLSVLEITSSKTFDALGHPNRGGLHDPQLGPSDKDELCASCGLNFIYCPGHVGHISLPLLTYNPVFFRTLYQLLRGSCFNCQNLLAPPFIVQLTLAQLQVLDYGLLGSVQELEELATEVLSESKARQSNVETAFETKTKLSEYVKKVVADANLEDARRTSRVKNVMECRQRIVRRFQQEHLMGAPRTCSYCHTARRSMSVQNNSRIIFSQKRISVARQSQLKSIQRNPVYDDPDSVMLEEEQQETTQEEEVTSGMEQGYLTPIEARKLLREVWKKEQNLLRRLYGVLDIGTHENPVDVFFLEAVLVPPTRFRPLNFMKGRKYENSQTTTLVKVLQNCEVVRSVLKVMKGEQKDSTTEEMESLKTLVSKLPGSDYNSKLHTAWFGLQNSVNSIFDSDLDKFEKNKLPGIKQILEKKEGLFRKHMMGKRVNYAARSVISPDPYIAVDEIGVPMVFAKKLSYPQPVTPWNVHELRRAVINGPDVYPGALLIQRENGMIQKLDPKSRLSREALAKELLTPGLGPAINNCKIVHRHLKSGDVLLLNRQPTLHKPSIMAHKARVLPKERTLRLHYANCKCYNADFDGDEMNAHFPQSELARAEAYNIANVSNQYLVPKDGTPLSGLIQDHIISGSVLCKKGRFFSREDYHELVFTALAHVTKPLRLLPPTVLKPEVLWTGKQIVSTVFINCIPEGKPLPNVIGKSKVPEKAWFSDLPVTGSVLEEFRGEMNESKVVIRNGELLCGILDKAHFGPTPYGLVHLCYELYGGSVSCLLLTAIARLFTHHLQIHIGFTLGIEDILVTPKANHKRKKIMRQVRKKGDGVAAEALGLEGVVEKEVLIDKLQDAHLSKEDRLMKQLDSVMKTCIDGANNEINKVCLPNGLLKKFPSNNLQLMVQSGAKGGMVNCMQISCLLGQIELEGRRVPLMISGKTLPSFLSYDTSPRAGGFIDGRFLTGIRPQEFFFHCMAGREGLVDTAVKTSRSGYLQRCLIKHLEGLVVAYDQTVRDSDGSVIQFRYGEDGMDILKNQMISPAQFPFLINNSKAVIDKEKLEKIKSVPDLEEVDSLKNEIKKWTRRVSEKGLSPDMRSSAFILFSNDHPNIMEEYQGTHPATGRPMYKEKLQEMWSGMDRKSKKKYKKLAQRKPDPVSAVLTPDKSFGAVCERLEKLIGDYITSNPHNLIRIQEDEEDKKKRKKKLKKKELLKREKFEEMLHYLVQKATCDPGEPVGLLAAQSIGEPSTQMTLNTFHFAGRGEMNVTLGIPRLREILMTASPNISTPSMNLHLLPVPDVEEKAEKLRVKMNSISLSQVLEAIEVEEVLDLSSGSMNRCRKYHITYKFLPYKAYRKKLFITPSKILHFMETKYIGILAGAVKRKLRYISDAKFVNFAKAAQTLHQGSNDGDDSEIPPRQSREEEGESSGDEEGGEGDTVSSRMQMRHNQEQEYEEKEEEEEMQFRESEDIDEPTLDVSDIKKDQDDENPESERSLAETDTPVLSGVAKKKSRDLKTEEKTRINKVVNLHSWVFDYKFDTRKEEWCTISVKLNLIGSKFDMTSLLEENAKNVMIHSMKNISRAFLVKDMQDRSGCGKMIQTEGVNFEAAFHFNDLVDVKRVYSNDIHAIANTFGIEAAARALVKELQNVFAVYGIEVDPRHLILVADYMTFDGTYKGCNRISMESNASPLQQMTFETTMNFLRTATLAGIQDNLQSPSSRLVLGQVVRSGTGCVDLLQRRFAKRQI